MVSSLLKRLPERRQFWLVFSTIVFIVFSWTIFHAFYQTTSWLYYMTVPGILVLYAYILGFALLESLLVSAFLTAYCFILPGRWLRDHFGSAGFLLALLLTLVVYLLRSGFEKYPKMDAWELAAIPLALLLGVALSALLLSKLVERLPKLARLCETIADRLTIFSFLYIPLGLLGWLVVLIRNIF